MARHLEDEDLSGIWRLTYDDVAREAEWVYRMANTLVNALALRLGGRTLAIPRDPRRAGFHVYNYYFAADIGQCLRYARAEVELEASYLADTLDGLSIVLGTRAVDLGELKADEARRSEVPVPEMDWTQLSDRALGAIVLAAQGRHLLRQGKPLPAPLASALTGWSLHRLGQHEDPETGIRMVSKKIKGVQYFDAKCLDDLLRLLEERFFYHKDYKAL